MIPRNSISEPTIWTIQKILSRTEEFFKNKQVPDPRLSAELLLACVLKMKRLDLYLQFERILIPAELNQYRQFVQRRASYEPVQHITGEQEFMGLTFAVSPDVLIPRPETELLVEAILREIEENDTKPLSILDIGTGSGAIAISLVVHGKECKVTAIDRSAAAIQIARRNARKLKVSDIVFLEHDALRNNGDSLPRFNLIVCNPPYISQSDFEELHPQVKDFEPREALLAGESGLEFIHQLIPKCRSLLLPSGKFFLEIGYDQEKPVKKLLKQQNFKNIEMIKDYNEFTRIVKADL